MYASWGSRDESIKTCQQKLQKNLSKKSYKSLENISSLGLKVSFQTNVFIEICYLNYSNILKF